MGMHARTRTRTALTVAVTLAECAHLAWEHLHGGIVSHNILARADLPAISNAWGLLLLPMLAWWLGGLALKPAASAPPRRLVAGGIPADVLAGFIGGLVMGAALASSFAIGLETATSVLFFGLFAIALLLRVYRAECVLGFVLGMTFTFGAVLPTAIASIIAAISATVHLLVWRPLGRVLSRARQTPSRGA
jgi:hypothetical protein